METVLEKILAECEEAMLRRKPIIFLETGEAELVRRVVESDRLVVRIYEKSAVSDLIPFADSKDILSGPMRLRGNDKCWSKIINVMGYSSLEKFSEGVGAGATDYGFPGKRSEDFPNLFLIPAPVRSEEDQRNIVAPEAYAGIRRYIDRYQWESAENSKLAASSILVYGERMTLPKELTPYCELIEEPFPEQEEIVALMDEALKKNGLPAMKDRGMWRQCARAMAGFPLMEVERLIDYILSSPDIGGGNGIYDEKFIRKTITKKKSQMLKKDRILELIEDGAGQNTKVGGMKKFTQWLSQNSKSLIDSGIFKEKTGANSVRGVLLCGVPGCGKSMAAHKVHQETGLPLLRMDIGSLMGKYVGDSEANMRKAIRQAEAMAPCILWTDELEKGFGNQGSEDGGVSKRMFGHFLTWLQECKAPVFNFATANDIMALPPEFFRSGRFDGLFALYMPTRSECIDILRNQLAAHAERASEEQGLFAFNPEKSAEYIFDKIQKDGFRFCNGADIEKLIAMALRRLFNEQQLNEPIALEKWIDSMKQALNETTVYGDGSKNIDGIACCHYRLLRDSFQPASEACILEKGDYQVVEDREHHGELKLEMTGEGDKKEARARNRVRSMSLYDLALYDAVVERLKVLAPLLEAPVRQKKTGIR